MTSNAIPAGPDESAAPGLVIYQSPTTRVVRSAGAVIWKEYAGPHAAQRLRKERDVLKRLAGVEGVAQLAASPTANVLALRDSGAGTLEQAMHTARLDIDTVLSLACQLARTLAGVHHAGVIHRDISPANILLSGALESVLIDFDLALAPAGPSADAREGLLEGERTAQAVGTLGYMAPEQTGRTGHAVDQRADLYSLGAILYEMATGRPPFEQTDTLQLMHDHLVREPVAPSQADARIPPALSSIILRLLAKAPEQRYQSADGLLHDLQRLGMALSDGGGSFELGERDFAARMAAPAQLVGREAECSKLLQAFADAMNSTRRTVLIAGPVGVGKSALINELKPFVAKAGGWLVSGKLDQYHKDGATDEPLAQAVRALGRLLLTETADAMEERRRRILKALGRNAGMIARASPEFALLLGVHDDVPAADPRDAETQMQQAMLELIGAIASPACPLVLVVDDMQWAGAFSFRLFERIMRDAQLRGVLLVGIYRSDEVDDGSALAPVLARWQQLALPPVAIALTNLDIGSIGEIARQMLRLAPEPSHELAEALNALTGGNPFDTIEMINALRVDGVLSLGASGWQWDEARVRRFIGRGNVVDLLAARIGRLPAASRELLECMSCLGSNAGYRLLCAATGLGEDELVSRLQPALEDGLLLADHTDGRDNVRFRHDRVQRAILDAMDDARRCERQLAMARRLAGVPALEGEAAQQYLPCVGLINAPDEQRRVAHMFHDLAQALASTATFFLAERYLAAASDLLDAIGEPADAPLAQAIDVARHRALYSQGRVDESDLLFMKIQARAPDPLDWVDTACLQVRRLDFHGRMAESLALGRSLLTQLGLQVPADYSDPHREQRLDALTDWIRQEQLIFPSLQAQAPDARHIGIYKLLARHLTSAYYGYNIDAWTWVNLEAQRLWAAHGPSEHLMGSVVGLSAMLIVRRRDFRTAYDVGRHIVTVAESLGFQARAAGARFMFSWGSSPWFEPLETSLEHAAQACAVFQAKGDDASHSCLFNIPKYQYLLEIGPNLDSCDAELEAAFAIARRTGNADVLAQHTCEQQFVRALRGLTRAPDSFDDGQFDEKAFMAKVSHLANMKMAFVPYRAFLGLLYGNADELAKNAMSPGWEGLLGMWYRATHTHFFRAMACAWQLQRRDLSDPASVPFKAALESCRNWMAQRAADQPHNFLHLLLLVEAEEAWALGDLHNAAERFDAAVVEASSKQRPWHRALITERAGVFNLAQGLKGASRELLSRARDQYRAWGATAKVEQMQREHAFLRTPSRSLDLQLSGSQGHAPAGSSNVSPDVLDLVGVLRASQALSSETSLERLTARVSDVLASLSGATRVLVLSHSEGQWRLLPCADTPDAMPVAQAGQQGLLPLSAFAYAERTGQALIVDDAAADERFARDPYFAALPVCSLLLAPIASQGLARGMLVLENRLGRAAFNGQRLDAVMLIAGQLAVSLANAQLYESLEQRVQARTRELQQTQAELVTTARRAGKAEIANNVLHNVGNVLNSINVSARVMRDTIVNSRLDGLTRAVGLVKEHVNDLPRFLEADPRGKALWPYLEQLAGALRAERDTMLGDLERLSLSVDHVIYVVASQQSHAGPSSVLEMTKPQELLEEALYLSDEAIQQRNIRIVRSYGEVPASALDRQRLVQVLVNLIGNAVQAMEQGQERELTLGSGLVHGEDGDRLRITVQDRGEGIAPAHLGRIFSHGFTTRASGHGFGLHSSAVAINEMGGKLSVHSDGPGQGAIFTIELPVNGVKP